MSGKMSIGITPNQPPMGSIPKSAVSAPIMAAPVDGNQQGNRLPSNNYQFNEALIKLLYQYRAEVQDMRTALDVVRKGEEPLDTQVSYLKLTYDNLNKITADLEQQELLAEADQVESIRKLLNLWEQLKYNPVLTKPDVKLEAQEQLKCLNQIERITRSVEFLIGYQTIPTRLAKWLGRTKAEYYVPFHRVFEDEVPYAEDRNKLITLFALQPDILPDAWFETAKGLVYRCSKKSDRLAKWGFVFPVVPAISLAFIFILCIAAQIVTLPNWPFQPANLMIFLTGWGAIGAGVLVHLLISVYKESQRNIELPSVLSFGTLGTLIDVKFGMIMLKYLIILVGLFGMAFTVGVDSISPVTAFLVGYSLDSFIELFSVRLDRLSTEQLVKLKQQLGEDK
jgi:hypothetical protein